MRTGGGAEVVVVGRGRDVCEGRDGRDGRVGRNVDVRRSASSSAGASEGLVGRRLGLVGCFVVVAGNGITPRPGFSGETV